MASGSPFTLSATGRSPPSEELKNASGSNPEPNDSAIESPSRVSMSSGTSRPVASEASWKSSSAVMSPPVYDAIWSASWVSQPSSKPIPNAAAVSAGRVSRTSAPWSVPYQAELVSPVSPAASTSRAPSSKRTETARPLKFFRASASAFGTSSELDGVVACRPSKPAIGPNMPPASDARCGEVLPGRRGGVHGDDAGGPRPAT